MIKLILQIDTGQKPKTRGEKDASPHITRQWRQALSTNNLKKTWH